MFAVFRTGGKQYRVRSGDTLRVEKLAAEAGDKVQFNDILMLGGDSPVVGAPLVEDAAVQAEIVDQIKGDKVIHFVKRRRKHGSQRTRGHRQQLTLLRVTDVLESGASASGVKEAVGAGTAPAARTAEKGQAAKATSGARGKKAGAGSKPKPAKAGPAAGSAGAKPANLLEAAREGRPDDLKRIAGVGPKLEGLLNENGVFHFDQIAAWNADEIAYMDDRLSFRGRIERDDWLSQAAAFAAEKE